MKKVLSFALALLILAVSVLSFASCGTKQIKIAVPNDTTNEARALRLLEKLGYIELKEGSGETATIRDIVKNPYNIKFTEADAPTLPNILQDVDYAVINSNFAIQAGISPITTEGTDVSYPNIIAVKDGTQATDKIKALVAAINSKAVEDYINKTFNGAIVCDLTNPTADGVDATVDYEALNGTTIKIAASPTPHAGILAVAKEVLAAKGITLAITEFSDYVQPNNVVESGEFDANFFQHIPYLDDFNAQNGTHLVSVLLVHHEPMGIYSANHKTLDDIKK